MSWSFPVEIVVMAGGSGTRFWPLSRTHRPKQLLPLLAGRSLLQATVARLLPLAGPERLLVVTGAELAQAVREQLPQLPASAVLGEPQGRDTAACVGWVAWRSLARGEDPVLLVVPADHWVGDEAAFRKVMGAALRCAQRTGGLVTVGMVPDRPETGYGYLELGEAAGEEEGVKLFRVRRFVEKPDAATARAFLAAGHYRWNGGIFAFKASAVAEAIRRHLPQLAQGLDAMQADTLVVGEEQALRRHYPTLPRMSLDFGVMEKAANIWAVDGAFPWHDVGSFTSFARILPRSAPGVTLGAAVTLETSNCVLLSSGPLVATLGVEGLVVVATPDAVLVTTLERAQEVKALVELVRAQGFQEVL